MADKTEIFQTNIQDSVVLNETINKMEDRITDMEDKVERRDEKLLK